MVQNFPLLAAAIWKFLILPVLLHRSKEAGMVTVWFVFIRGSQKLSVNFTLVKSTAFIG
jgi:hypothetical protein